METKKKKRIWCLKGLGDGCETIVPKTRDPEVAKQELIEALKENKSAYEEGGFILEEKILDGIEFTPCCFFWNGKPVCYDLDLETKTIGAGETGGNVGCGTNLIIRTEPNEPLNQLAFPPYLMEQYKDTVGMRVIDMGLLLDPEDNSIYFLEFCPNRVGWDAFPAELTMADGAEKFFNAIVLGKNPLTYKYGTATRIFNDTTDKHRRPAAGVGVTYTKDLYDYVFPYDVALPKCDEDEEAETETEEASEQEFYKYETAGYCKDVAAITCKMDDIQSSIETIYFDYLKDFSVKDMQYRPIDDFESMSYGSSILNRLDYILRVGLLKDKQVWKDLAAIRKAPRRTWHFEAQKQNKQNDDDTGENDSEG
jgi:hypothetical protein